MATRGGLVRVVLALLAVLAVAPVAGRAGPVLAVEHCRFTPTAVFGDGKDLTTLTVKLAGGAPQAVKWEAFSPMPEEEFSVDGRVVPRSPAGFSPILLYDDGTHGDEVAGDGTFTRSGIGAHSAASFSALGNVTVLEAGGSSDKSHYWDFAYGVLFVIPRDLAREVWPVARDWRASEHLLNYRDRGSVYPLAASATAMNSPDFVALGQRLYAHSPDAYDFLTVYTAVPNFQAFYHVIVGNDVDGIGLAKFSNASSYGSGGRLKGINYLKQSGAPHLHELLHQWGVFLKNSGLTLPGDSHWGAVNVPGALWGMGFEPNGAGTFAVTSRYSEGRADGTLAPLELYLMGLIPKWEVPNTWVLEGLTTSGALSAFDVGDVIAVPFHTVDMHDIVLANGSRSPSYAASRKDFTDAGILITNGRFASEAEMALFDLFQQHFGATSGGPLAEFGYTALPFHVATRGLAWIDTGIVP